MKQENDTVRVGLIGYGYAGKTFHAPLITAVDGLLLTVVGSSRQDVVQAAFPGVTVCSAEEVTTHPDVDLVVIATPNDSHFPLAVSALRAGKHVVLDKPFTVTLAEARELLAIAEQCGRLLSAFHNRRWESEILGVQEALASGRLGDVSHFECHMDRFRPNVRQRWRENPGPGAGLWFDLGPHLIDLTLHLFGLPDSVHGNFGVMRAGGQTDDWAHVQLNYRHMHVILHATLLAAGGGPRALLHGTRGSWAKFGADVQERQLVAGMSPNDPAFGVDPTPCVFYNGETGEQTEVPSPRGHQQDYFAGVRDAILKNMPLPVSARDAVTVMAILETSFESGRSGQTLSLPLTAEENAWWNVRRR